MLRLELPQLCRPWQEKRVEISTKIAEFPIGKRPVLTQSGTTKRGQTIFPRDRSARPRSSGKRSSAEGQPENGSVSSFPAQTTWSFLAQDSGVKTTVEGNCYLVKSSLLYFQ